MADEQTGISWSNFLSLTHPAHYFCRNFLSRLTLKYIIKTIRRIHLYEQTTVQFIRIPFFCMSTETTKLEVAGGSSSQNQEHMNQF